MDEKEVQKQISEWVEYADKRVRDYESAKRKGNFEIECPYPEIIGLYEHINQILLQRGWNHHAAIYQEQIRFYKEKLEENKKLLEFEAKKAEKEKYFKELHKIQEVDTMELVLQSLDKEEELLNFEEKKQREKEEAEAIYRIIDTAEKLEREYELEKKKRRILMAECPYEKIIGIYKDAIKRFETIGWKKEIPYLIDSINHYNELIEKDKLLRDLAKRK
jgi:hypothetical protein